MLITTSNNFCYLSTFQVQVICFVVSMSSAWVISPNKLEPLSSVIISMESTASSLKYKKNWVQSIQNDIISLFLSKTVFRHICKLSVQE